MAIEDKPTPSWAEADLQSLCEEQRRENPRLEFKREVALDRPADKDEIEHDVQGLANAGGGHLIVGIAERELDDGSKVAGELVPIQDGGVYEQLNNLLDGRGTPPVPFEIYAIAAAGGGIYIVIEVHGARRPHMANDARYYIRRNLLVRRMTEAEVADSYRQRFQRERRALEPEPPPDAGPDPADRVRRGLTDAEFAQYQQDTGDPERPGWLAIWAHPVPLQPDLVDPRHYTPAEIREVPLQGIWREPPLQYFNLERFQRGFVGQLPPQDDAYPAYFVRIWEDGLLEWGDLQAPAIRYEQPEANRLIATHAVAEYVHDFLIYAQALLRKLQWEGEVRASARLSDVDSYVLAVQQGRYFRQPLVVRDATVEARPWNGRVDEVDRAAVTVAHDLSDRLFIAAGADRAYFFDQDGNFTGGR